MDEALSHIVLHQPIFNLKHVDDISNLFIISEGTGNAFEGDVPFPEVHIVTWSSQVSSGESGLNGLVLKAHVPRYAMPSNIEPSNKCVSRLVHHTKLSNKRKETGKEVLPRHQTLHQSSDDHALFREQM